VACSAGGDGGKRPPNVFDDPIDRLRMPASALDALKAVPDQLSLTIIVGPLRRQLVRGA